MRKENNYDVIVVGAGIFGVTTALEMQERGYKVALFDPGPLPHPLAASTDISKVVRMEYGSDEQYTEMVEQAEKKWLQWNKDLGDELFHNTGVAMLTRAPMRPESFEFQSYSVLLKRGHSPERLAESEIPRRFPAYKPGVFVDGFFHARGGYVESGRAVSALLKQAQRKGITLQAGQAVHSLIEEHDQVIGIRTRTGEPFHADMIVLCVGAWISLFVDELAPLLKTTGHPVFHVKPGNIQLFAFPNFVVLNADITATGWYCFPVHPREQVVKIANHGIGQVIHPEHDQRIVTDSDLQAFHSFLEYAFPSLVDAPITFMRCCLYVDTPDGDFLIARHPQRPGLTIATGDNGHAFKFAPILGGLIADAIEEQANPWLSKFSWRDFSSSQERTEASRHHE